MLYNLVCEMKKKGMSLAVYACALGITEKAAAEYLTERGDMPMRLLKKTGELFPKCSFSYLFSGGSDREARTELIQQK